MNFNNSHNVMQSLELLNSNKITPRELYNFTEFCCNVSYSCVHKRKRRIGRLTQRIETSLEDIATNALIPLFSRNESNQYYVLVNAYKNWQPEIKTPGQAVDFLNKIIDNRVSQQITALLKEYDPVFGKLLSYINNQSKKECLVKRNINGVIYITFPDSGVKHGFIDHQNFQFIPAVLFTEGPSMLRSILKYIESETPFKPAIPQNLLIERLKKVNFGEYSLQADGIHISSDLIISDLVDFSLKEALRKLKTTYVEKGKLSRQEADAIKAALCDIVQDLKDGGLNPGLYDYLKSYVKGMSKEDYKLKYHNTLEYLYKTIKKAIVANWNN